MSRGDAVEIGSTPKARAGCVPPLGNSQTILVSLLLLAMLAPLAAAQAPAPATAAGGPLEAVLETEHGEIVIRLLAEVAPQHVRHFAKTARAGGYDGTTFHRLIAGGIIQGGDPLSKDPAKAARYGTGGLGLLKAEFSDRPFLRGTVAAARRPSSADSGGSQFFICLREQPSLVGQYTVFGEVTAGMDVADRISTSSVEGDRPTTRIEIRRVQIREASAGTP
jgi:peptidyl-prolyl cis-trans isomerase B (cyclophilin B)